MKETIHLCDTDIEFASRVYSTLSTNLGRIIKGKDAFISKLLACLASGGHVLIEDKPGLGKTTVAKALSHLIGINDSSITFRRIQFTPDLLPYDITGVDIFNPENHGFVFQEGPIFAHIVLADEINRTTPKVQSALLEAMGENQVTVGNITHNLPDFFFIIATQNPIDHEGTYPLPHAELDRFMMKLSLGYPDPEFEKLILTEDPHDMMLPELKPVISLQEIIELKKLVPRVYLDDSLKTVIVTLVNRLREKSLIKLGPSPRASLALARVARSWALQQKRGYVIDQDIIDVACDVLSHRLMLKDFRQNIHSIVREEIIEVCSSIKK